MLRRTSSILGQRNFFADGNSTLLLERGVRTFGRPSEKGWNTYNIDGVFPIGKGKLGKPACSCVEINEAKKLSLWWCKDLPHAISSEHAKLLACFEGMQVAISRGVKKLILESDCENVLNKIWGVERIQSGDDLVTYSEIWDTMHCFEDFEFKLIHQEDNSVAELAATTLAYNKPFEEVYINEAVARALDRPYRLRQERISLLSARVLHSKCINRGMGTLIAGLLALGIHWIARHYGKIAEPVILGVSVFSLHHFPDLFQQ